MPGLEAMASVWCCLLLALVLSQESQGLEIVSSHSRTLNTGGGDRWRRPIETHGSDVATQVTSYQDKIRSLRRMESSRRESNKYGRLRTKNTGLAGRVVDGDNKRVKIRPAVDTPFQLLKTMHPSPQSTLQRMQQEFQERKKTTLNSLTEQRKSENSTPRPLKNSREIKEYPSIFNQDTNDTKPLDYVGENLNIISLFKNIEFDQRDYVKKDVQSEPLPQSNYRSLRPNSQNDYSTGSGSASMKSTNQLHSESNLMSKLQGTLSDFVDNTVNFFHPTITGNGYYYDDPSVHEQSRKIDSGSFKQTVLEYFKDSKPEKFSAVGDLELEKNNSAGKSSSGKRPIVEKSNEFGKHPIPNESNNKAVNNLGEFVPVSWSQTDDVQMKFDDEPEFPVSIGFNEFNSNNEIQLENEMDSLSGFVNSTMTQEILETIQPVLSDALEHSNFTEDELLNVLENPERLRQALIDKTTDDHAMGLLEVFQHYKGLSTYEILQNMTQLDPSKLSRYVGGLASEVRDSLHKTWRLGTLFGTGGQEAALPREADDSHYSESKMYPTYSDGMQRPPPEFSQRNGYSYDFPQISQYGGPQSRLGSINISNPLFNFTYVSPNLTLPAFPSLQNLTSKCNSTSPLAKLPLLATLTQSSIIGLGALLAVLIGSHYLKYDGAYESESSYLLVAPKTGHNSQMYAKKKLILELPEKSSLQDSYHRTSVVQSLHTPKILKDYAATAYVFPPKGSPNTNYRGRAPSGRNKTPPSFYQSKRPTYRTHIQDSFEDEFFDGSENPQKGYYVDEHGFKIDPPGREDHLFFDGLTDVQYDSRQQGQTSYRGSYEAVRDSSSLFLDSPDKRYRTRSKPNRGRYSEQSSKTNRPRRRPDSQERFENTRKTRRPDRHRNFSPELKRGIYESREKGRTSVSRPYRSREDDRRSKRRPQSSRRHRGRRYRSYERVEPEYRGSVLVEDVLPATMLDDEDDFGIPPLSMKLELGVPYFEDDNQPSRGFRSSDAWRSNQDRISRSSWQDDDYGDNAAQFGTHSPSVLRSPGYDNPLGSSDSTRRSRDFASSTEIKWNLEPYSHTSSSHSDSEAQPKDLVVWSDQPLSPGWSKESSRRRGLTSRSAEPVPIQDSSPISNYDIFGNIDDEISYFDHQPGQMNDDTRHSLDKLLQKYRRYSTKFLSKETTVENTSAPATFEGTFISPLVQDQPESGFAQRHGDLEMPRRNTRGRKRKRVRSGRNPRVRSDRTVRQGQLRQEVQFGQSHGELESSPSTILPSLKATSKYSSSFF